MWANLSDVSIVDNKVFDGKDSYYHDGEQLVNNKK